MTAGHAARTVSVVIPAYQAERYLAEAIESVLVQPGADLQVIVVDDGSTDGTADVARRYGSRIQLVEQPNAGPGPARNRGIAMATGELLAFCDADDRWTPGRLAHQLAALGDPAVDGVYGLVHQFVTTELAAERQVLLPDAPVAARLASAMVIRRSAFDRVGPFPATRAPDVAWMTLAVDLGCRLVALDEVVLERRIHGANLGLTETADGHRARLQAVKQMLDRRRGSGAASADAATTSHPTAP